MTVKVVLVILVTISFAKFSNSNESCKADYEPQHTMCAYTPENKCKNYGYELVRSGLTPDEKNNFLDLHNKWRQKIAAGEETRGQPGPQPAAKSMPNLNWNEELAQIAQHWADQCIYSHDSYRKISKYDVGQNIAYIALPPNITYVLNPTTNTYIISIEVSNTEETLENVAELWYNEVDLWNGADTYQPLKFDYGGKDILHYIQIVWSQTIEIGCGAVRYVKTDKYKYTYLVCNYGPRGNIVNERIYIPKDDKQLSLPVNTKPYEPTIQRIPSTSSNQYSYDLPKKQGQLPYDKSRHSVDQSVPAPITTHGPLQTAGQNNQLPYNRQDISENQCERLGYRLIQKSLTLNEKNVILKLHNELRKKVAMGTETRGQPGPQPAAESIPNLRWNGTLEKIAQYLANQCNNALDPSTFPETGDVGLNLVSQVLPPLKITQGSRTYYQENEREMKVEDAVLYWYNTVELWDRRDTYKPFRFNYRNNEVHSYTQIVWAKNTEIGCAAVRYANSSLKTRYLYLVCVYKPGGNFIGELVYVPKDYKQPTNRPISSLNTIKDSLVPPRNTQSSYPGSTRQQQQLQQQPSFNLQSVLPKNAEILGIDEVTEYTPTGEKIIKRTIRYRSTQKQ